MSDKQAHHLITDDKTANLHSSLKRAKRIVIKVGSSLVTNQGKGVDLKAISQWAQQIAGLRQLHKQVVLVSSGAIAEGMARLGWQQRPKQMNQLQTAAAVGQMGIAQAYESAFRTHHLQTAQILLTHEDLADRHRYLNARSALFTMLELGVLPVINENDTVITDEIRLGDNDTLGALVANLIEADVLVILTDQKGLYDSDPRSNPDAKFIYQAHAGDPFLEQIAGGAGSHIGTGGMLTKVLAAKRAARSGASTIIASGQEPDLLLRLAKGEAIGTELHSNTAIFSARKQWLADQLHVSGYLTLDAGALEAIVNKGKSLLPIGVTQVQGHFDRGDLVACMDANGVEYARGLVNYNATDAIRIMRQPTQKIEALLGFFMDQDIIHRNNMVITKCLLD